MTQPTLPLKLSFALVVITGSVTRSVSRTTFLLCPAKNILPNEEIKAISNYMDVDIISNYMDENMLDISLPVKKIKKKSIQGSKQKKKLCHVMSPY